MHYLCLKIKKLIKIRAIESIKRGHKGTFDHISNLSGVFVIRMVAGWLSWPCVYISGVYIVIKSLSSVLIQSYFSLSKGLYINKGLCKCI